MNSVLLVAAIPSEAILFALAVLHTVLPPFGTESSRIVDITTGGPVTQHFNDSASIYNLFAALCSIASCRQSSDLFHFIASCSTAVSKQQCSSQQLHTVLQLSRALQPCGALRLIPCFGCSSIASCSNVMPCSV